MDPETKKEAKDLARVADYGRPPSPGGGADPDDKTDDTTTVAEVPNEVGRDDQNEPIGAEDPDEDLGELHEAQAMIAVEDADDADDEMMAPPPLLHHIPQTKGRKDNRGSERPENWIGTTCLAIARLHCPASHKLSPRSSSRLTRFSLKVSSTMSTAGSTSQGRGP